MTVSSNTEQPLAGRREWIALAVLALPTLLLSMDLTVLHLAVPALTADLAPSSAQLLWIIDIYGFLIAGSLITMGTLGDRIGRRRVLLIGGAAFAVASVLAAFSTSAEMLIVARALLGIAGATQMPSTMSLITVLFKNERQRAFGLGVWFSCFSLGGILGPILGGAMLEYFWWGSVFLLNVPVMALLLALGPFLLPEYRAPAAGRLDPVSALLSLIAVLGIIYGVKSIATGGPLLAAILVIAVGVAVGTVFVRRQLSLPDPLLDMALFRIPAFNAALAANAVGVFAFFGAWLFVMQYLQLVLGLSPLVAGAWTIPSSLTVIATSNGAPLLLRYFERASIVAAGLTIGALGFLLFALLDQDSGFWAVVISTVVIVIGMAPVFTLATDLVLSVAPPERAGGAAAVSETASELGGALGIAVLGSVGVGVYRAAFAHNLPPDVPESAARAALDTLAAAVETATHLPPATAEVLLETARESFITGLHVASVAGALALLATAATSLLLLRPRAPR